jgi:hypothetical protein
MKKIQEVFGCKGNMFKYSSDDAKSSDELISLSGYFNL